MGPARYEPALNVLALSYRIAFGALAGYSSFGGHARPWPILDVSLIAEDYDTAIDFRVRVLQFELIEDVPSTTTDGRTNC